MDRSRYQGKNFALLLVATCAPAAVLYLRLVLEVITAQGNISQSTARTLGIASVVVLMLFVFVQLASATYLRRMLKPRENAGAKVLQFAGVFLMGLLFSITGAIMLEAFGINVLVRAGLVR